MAYTNSPLVVHTNLSPNHSGERTHSIDTITPHCVVGQCSIESLGNVFAPTSRQASSNYGIGTDGRVGLFVEEKNRSWCSSSRENDQRAITIECASDNFAPYAFNATVYNKLVELCADICKRNGKNKILWIPDKSQRLAYNPASNEMKFTWHCDWAASSCPGEWLKGRMQDLTDKVNAKLSASSNVSPVLAQTPTQSPGQSFVVIKTANQNVSDNEKNIWDFLMARLNNAYGVAGLMGNLYAESGLRPNNLQNSYEKKFGMTDEQYTAAVDIGAYNNFVKDSAGYGLAQWTYWSRKQNLLNYAKSKGASIGDLTMQLEFLMQELNGYGTVLSTLKSAKSVKEASDVVLLQFERPADQSDTMKNKRTSYGMTYYEAYSKAVAPASISSTTATATSTISTPISPTTSKKKYVYDGLDYSPIFDPVYYSNKYADLKLALGNNAERLFEHFYTFGMNECRMGNANFNPVIYRSNYADLNNTYGSDWKQYYRHYLLFGISEGRRAQ